MTSPFSTFEEFSSAEGPIYTFANNSAMLTLLLITSVGIFLYFLYSSFSMKQMTAKPANPAMLGVLLVAGIVSSMGAWLGLPSEQSAEANRPASRSEVRTAQTKPWQPLALLGLSAMGGASLRRNSTRPSRGKRRGGLKRPR